MGFGLRRGGAQTIKAILQTSEPDPLETRFLPPAWDEPTMQGLLAAHKIYTALRAFRCTEVVGFRASGFSARRSHSDNPGEAYGSRSVE